MNFAIPPITERIYADTLNELCSRLETLRLLMIEIGDSTSTVERGIPDVWKISIDYFSFREDFVDGIKAKIEIIEGYLKQYNK